MKSKMLVHPRMLAQPYPYKPKSPEENEEYFCNGIFRFNISAIIKETTLYPEKYIRMHADVSEWHDAGYSSNALNDENIKAADLTRPIIILEIAPDRLDFEDFHEGMRYRGYVLADGHHRLEKAYRAGLTVLPSYVLRMEYHIPFMYAGYEAYVEYWNGKLADRITDIQREKRLNKP